MAKDKPKPEDKKPTTTGWPAPPKDYPRPKPGSDGDTKKGEPHE